MNIVRATRAEGDSTGEPDSGNRNSNNSNNSDDGGSSYSGGEEGEAEDEDDYHENSSKHQQDEDSHEEAEGESNGNLEGRNSKAHGNVRNAKTLPNSSCK
jgi:hypothetical protein